MLSDRHADLYREVRRKTPGVAFAQVGQHFTGGQVLESSLPFTVHVLREVDLPTQSVVQREIRSHTPRVLDIREGAFLTFRGFRRGAYVPRERLHLSKQ